MRLGRWLPPLALMAVIFGLSAQESLDSGLGTLDVVLRKLAHLGLYALLAILWWRAVRGPLSSGRALVAAVLVSSAYGATDEYHQSFVVGRSGNALDWGIDTLGAAAGALGARARERIRG